MSTPASFSKPSKTPKQSAPHPGETRIPPDPLATGNRPRCHRQPLVANGYGIDTTICPDIKQTLDLSEPTSGGFEQATATLNTK
jgi:hypothetical protein